MKIKWIALLLVTALAFMGGCIQKDSNALTPVVFSPQPKINETRAIAIASRHVPIEVVIESEIIAQPGSFQTVKGPIDTWAITFNTGRSTREQLESSGWLADTNTIFDGDDPYSRVSIILDENSGIVLYKKASSNGFLGQIPTEGPIREEEAKLIASRYVPYNVLVMSRIESKLNGDMPKSKQSWLIYYVVNVSQKDLGWRENNYTHLDKLNTGENYFELVVEINKNSGDLVRRAAFATPK